MEDKKTMGLGDLVARAIEVVAPKFAEANKDCPTCKRRRERLNRFKNNINSNFK